MSLRELASAAGVQQLSLFFSFCVVVVHKENENKTHLSYDVLASTASECLPATVEA